MASNCLSTVSFTRTRTPGTFSFNRMPGSCWSTTAWWLKSRRNFRQELVRAITAAVRSDVDGLINAVYKLDMLELDVSPSTIREAAQAIIAIHFDRQLTQRQIQEITYQILNTFYRFPLRLPSNLVYILRTAC